MIYILIGIAGSVILAVVLPKGCLQSQVERDNIFAPIIMAVMATPIYSTPLLAMSQIGGMFQHGNSIGAAFSLLILGAGANIGLLCWFARTYGIRKVLAFCLLLVTITVGLAYAIDKPLYPKGIEPAGHSHAFDVYTHPFFMQSGGLIEVAVRKGKDFYVANEVGATFILFGMVMLGALLSIVGRKVDFESWFTQGVPSESRFDIIVPGWILGIVSVGALVVASIVGCYLYYPGPDELLADFFSVHAETVLTANTQEWEAAEKWIAYSDDLSRRLEVGVFLRRGSLDEFMTTKAKIYREKLDALRESVESKNVDTVGPNAMELHEAYRRMSAAFRE